MSESEKLAAEPTERPLNPAWCWQDQGGWLRQRPGGFTMGIVRHSCPSDGQTRYRPSVRSPSGAEMSGVWVSSVGPAEADAARLVAHLEDFVRPGRLSPRDQARRNLALLSDRTDLAAMRSAVAALQSTEDPSLLPLHDELMQCLELLYRAKPSEKDVQPQEGQRDE